jgi:hypothetical protein
MESAEPFREFSRELLLRFDRALRDFDRSLQQRAAESERRHEQVMAEIARGREESREYFRALKAETAEVIAEGRAGRQALLAILDRLDGGGAAPAT